MPRCRKQVVETFVRFANGFAIERVCERRFVTKLVLELN